MSTRSVVVRLEAEIAGFVQDLKKAEKATADLLKAQEALGREIDKSSKQTDKSSDSSKKDAEAKKKQADATEKVGTALTIMGAATVAALGATTKAAMDWEAAWAGVNKTVDGTPEQMGQLEEELRELARTLPATHTEIAAVAEAAGQLGIARDDVTAFTKTMIDLSETTNLSADEAATSMAQFMNVMGTSPEMVGNLASALVALGNDGASTEKDIIMMAQRISGAGKLVGASEADVFALSNALASVGVPAELGGGVVSRVMQRMYADVMEGGEGLSELAKVAGVSSSEFATAFENDPVRAMDLMIKGLSAVKDEGGNVVETMKDIGIKGTEETGVILRLAGAGDLLVDSLDLGAKAIQNQDAILEEAGKRYETTEAKVQIAWNNIKDASIDAGASILPVVASIAESVSGLAQLYGSLPEPVQTALTGLVGIVGVAALVGGAVLTLTPKLLETRDAFRDLSASGSKIPGSMRNIAIGAAAATAAYALFNTALATHNAGLKTKGLGEYSLALRQIGDDSKNVDDLFKGLDFGDSTKFEGQVNGIQDALRELNRGGMDHWGADMGANNGIKILRDNVDGLDKTMASAVSSGNPEMAAKAWGQLTIAADQQGVSMEKLKSLFPEYVDSLAASEAGASGAADAQSMLEDELANTGVALDGVIGDMDKFLEQLYASGMLTRDERGALRDYQASIDEISESIKKNGTSLDENTAKGRANQAALDGIAVSGQKYVEALAAGGASEEELQAAMTGTYDAMIVAAGQFGITGDKADALARYIIGIPEGVEVDSWMADSAKKTAEATKQAIDAIPKNTTVNMTYKTHGAPFKVSPRDVLMDSFIPGKAGGGDLDMAPGPKGVDSQLFYGAKGEHVFTAREVDLMGGQQAVYKFRADLNAGVPAYANGGGLGAAPSTTIMATNQVARGASSSSDTRPVIAEGAIQINGATDAARVAQAVEDKISNRLAKGGWRI